MKKQTLIIGIIGIFLFIQPIGAQTWDPSKRLTWNTSPSKYPDIIVDSNNNIHVVWSENSLSTAEIYYKKSTDGGVSWTTKRLTWNSGGSYLPAITTGPSNNLYIVWGDETPGNREIHFKKSSNGGTTWGATKRLTWLAGYSLIPTVAVDSSGIIHVVWQKEFSNCDIYYKRSTDGGLTWTGAKRLTWTNNSRKPVIAVDTNDNIHIAWEVDQTGEDGEIFYKRSSNGGVTWAGTKRLTWAWLDCQSPAIAIDSNNYVHIVWNEYNWNAWPFDILPSELSHKRSLDSGITWKKTKHITSLSHESIYPVVAADSNNTIYVVWVLYNLVGSYDNELFFKKSTNNGLYWSPAKKLTWSYDSNAPSITIDSSDNIYVVFENGFGINQEIYFKKGK